jgi:hypothetical protein
MCANFKYRSHAKSSPLIESFIAALFAIVVALALMTILQKQQQHFESLRPQLCSTLPISFAVGISMEMA